MSAAVGLLAEASTTSIPPRGTTPTSCNDTYSMDDRGYHRCDPNAPKLQKQNCKTFALLHANSYYMSLSNLSLYLGLNRTAIAEANRIPASTDLLRWNQPLLIPIDCCCSGNYFQAAVMKTAVEGDSFSGIAASFEGLTTCRAIQEMNPNLPLGHLSRQVQVLVPLICACPAAFQLNQGLKFFLSYPMFEGDTFSVLASVFNTSVEAIASVNNKSAGLVNTSLPVLTPLLIPITGTPDLQSLSQAHQPNSPYFGNGIPLMNVTKKNHSRRRKTRKIGLYVALSGAALGMIVAAASVVSIIRMRKKPSLRKMADAELQRLNERNGHGLKEEKEEPQDPLIEQNLQSTPRKGGLEIYTLEELRRATEDFSSSNLIEGSVFHGRLNGKNLAIRHTTSKAISKIEFELFDGTHHHPNIVRLLGTCVANESDSYLVFEYAKNGSLKDWLHGGLAMKSQFIASCYCFLTWNQRLKICLQVAMGLHYMHHTMNPGYVHQDIKSRNVLLDEEFNAKIGSFGMRRCCNDELDDDSKRLLTGPAAWSRGYLAPEHLEHGTISPSIDIFAFGVVLLEALSGKTPVSRGDNKEGSILLSQQIKIILRSENAAQLRDWMDSAIGEAYSLEAAVKVAKLASSCVEDNPSSRPTAEEVVETLARLVEELPGEQISICESSTKSEFK
ncbi:hypothetical protein ACLOJK_019763 [Asimina triloba]